MTSHSTPAFDLLRVVACTLLTALAACSSRHVGGPPAPVPAVMGADNSYIDLRAGSTLQVVMPLLKSGQFRSNFRSEEETGHSISIKADDFVGYVRSTYTVTGKNGVVQLAFSEAWETKQGQTLPVPAAPALPFELPRKREYIRLVYLVRVSQADHNMAIVGAKHFNALNEFTARLKKDPGVCEATKAVFCSWVPAGIAVRPGED